MSNQADVLWLLYLLGPVGLTDPRNRLGYSLTCSVLERTLEYYHARTSDGSTLSRVVHASVLARIDGSRAWEVFREALVADLDDTQGGTTREGIHLGAMSGTVDLVVRAFAGLQTESDALTFDPRLPGQLNDLGFQVQYRGHRIELSLKADTLQIRLPPGTATPISVGFKRIYAFRAGGEGKE